MNPHATLEPVGKSAHVEYTQLRYWFNVMHVNTDSQLAELLYSSRFVCLDGDWRVISAY